MKSESAFQRKLKGLETEYLRKGYRVLRSSELGPNLEFLRRYRPDLVAERDDDHVVIEVKSARSLKGSNQLRELAETIAAQPGWRFELVTVGADTEELDSLRKPQWLDDVLRWPLERPFEVTDFIYLIEVLSCLVRGIALLNDMKLKGKSTDLLANELAFAGIISQDQLERVESYLTLRNELMHQIRQRDSLEEQGRGIVALCRELDSDYLHSVPRSSSRGHGPQ